MAQSPESILHCDFPQDDRVWWIRWADYIDPNASEGTPKIQLLLSPFPKRTEKQFDDGVKVVSEHLIEMLLREKSPEIYRVQIQVSSIPFFPLGTLVLKGRPCGKLIPETREYTFDTNWKRDFLEANQPSPAHKPKWWKNIWNVLPATSYPRGEGAASFVVVLYHTTSSKQVLIPSYEIFRTFYGTNTKLADVFLSGPWSLPSVYDRIINPAHTAILPDGTWQIGLRNGLGADTAWLVANCAMTEFGADCATQLTEEYPQVRRLQQRAARLKADIPFVWSTLSLKVEGFSLYNSSKSTMRDMEKFVVLRIAEISLPSPPHGFPPKIIARLDNNNVERSSSESKERNGAVVVQSVIVPDEDGNFRVSSDESPSHLSIPQDIVVDIPCWKGLDAPEIVRSVSQNERSATTRYFLKETDIASTAGRPASGRDVGRITSRQNALASDDWVFSDLAQALNDMRASGKIDHWRSVKGLDDFKLPIFRQGYEVLKIPLRFAQKQDGSRDSKLKRWILPTKGKHKGEHRKIMVVEVKIGERVIYCLEVEPFSVNGSYCLAIARFEGGNEKAGIIELIRLVVLNCGVWTKIKPDCAIVSSFLVWKHRYMGDTEKCLSRDALFNAIARV